MSGSVKNGDVPVCDGEREFNVQGGSCPTRAVEGDPAADGVHAVLKAGQAGAPGEVGAADAVVVDGDVKDLSRYLDVDADGGGAGVLGRVGQRLSDDVVGADLYRLRQPAFLGHPQINADRGAAGGRPWGGVGGALGPDGRGGAP